MVIDPRQVSPLGAPYRTPLGAFGSGPAGEVVPGIWEVNAITSPALGPGGYRLNCTVGTWTAEVWNVVLLVDSLDVANSIPFSIFENNRVMARGETSGTTYIYEPAYTCFDNPFEIAPRTSYPTWTDTDTYPYDNLEYFNYPTDLRVYQSQHFIPKTEGPVGWIVGEPVNWSIVT